MKDPKLKGRQYFWVKINKGSLAMDEDASKLTDLQKQYEAEFNTHTCNAMWFNFDWVDNGIAFARGVVLLFPYVSVSMGRSKD